MSIIFINFSDDGGTPIECYEIEKMDEDTGRWVPCGRSTKPECAVTNLTPGKRYKFRVRACNKEGDSDELETDHAIVAKDPYDPPGQPGRPEATDCDKDHVDLKWTPPESDGGAPITGYVIEKRRKSALKWQPAKEVKSNTTHATVPELEEGEEYEFRVTAVNDGGLGEPSRPSQTIIAGRPPDAPQMPRVEKITKEDVTLSWNKPRYFTFLQI